MKGYDENSIETSFDKKVDELVDNPNLIISAMFKIMFSDEDEILEDSVGAMSFLRKNELLKSELTVLEGECKLLRENVNREKHAREKLGKLLRSYTDDAMSEDEVLKRTETIEHDLLLNKYIEENKRLKKALEEYERIFKKLGVEL